MKKLIKKIKNYLTNPKKYRLKGLINDKIYHKINGLSHPSIFPKTLFGKILGNRLRYLFYNKLYNSYPLFDSIIDLKSKKIVESNKPLFARLTGRRGGRRGAIFYLIKTYRFVMINWSN